jgi:hypothetical protein
VIAGAADLSKPLAESMQRRLLATDLLGIDDTTCRALDRAWPTGVRTARFWLYRGYDAAPYDVFDFRESRSRDGPQTFLQGFRGTVKVDAYGVNDGVYFGSGERIRASCCLAHARRKFEEAKSSHPRQAAEALAFFQELYDVEDRAREFAPDARQALRQAESKPLLDRLKRWADDGNEAVLPKSKLGEALGYLLNQWNSLINYLEDGRIPIDTNDVERDLRRLTIGRGNWLFVGSPEAGPRAAILYTLVASAARHRLELWSYLRDVLTALASGEPDLPSLLPDVYAAAHPEAVRLYRRRESESRARRKRQARKRRRALANALKRRR